MDVIFNKFYEVTGVRTLSGMTMPKIWPVRALPICSAVHFLSEGPELFPDVSNIYLKFADKRVALKNYFTLLDGNHSQSKSMQATNNLILNFVQENKQFVNFAKPISDVSDEKQLVFCNYNLVKGIYNYQESNKLAYFWKWEDRSKLMWSTVNEACDTSQRNHFYDFEMPLELPSKARLTTYAVALNADISKYFPNSQALFLLDLWKWLDPAIRSTSTLGLIKPANLRKCNILFHVQDGRSVTLNLGYLNSWIEGQPNATEFKNIRALSVDAIRLVVLKFLMNLQALNVELLASQRESETAKEDERENLEADRRRVESGRDDDDASEVDPEEEQPGGTDSSQLLDDAVQQVPKTAASVANGKKVQADKAAAGTSDGFKEGEEGTDDASFDASLKQIEEEAKALEAMEDRRVALREIKPETAPDYDIEDGVPSLDALQASVYKPRAADQRLLERLDQAVGKGNITAADYRKVMKTVELQATAKDPFGSNRTLKEMSTLTQEDIQFDHKKNELVTDDRVLDKSMGKSVVEGMDRDYVRKTMQKDIIACLMDIQSAGVVVTDIQTEEPNSVLGAFNSYSIQLKPIDGRSSSLRIKHPKVYEDGTFKSNGVRYHMRKQRVDLPIRKINSERIALSSFAAKLFVYRSPKKADSGLTSIIKQITAGSIGANDIVTQVRPANVFDNKFEAPYIYGALATHYKSFNIKHLVFGELSFDFDQQTRLTTLLNKGEQAAETDGRVLVGKTSKGRPIYVGRDNQFVAILPNGEQPLGDIYDLLSIDRLKVPVDPAMIKIRGMALPVGLVLARTMGLKALLKFSQAKYRLVKGRQQKNLSPYEYAISFADYSLVLDRRDVKASLIFGGFHVPEKYIKAFPIASFERKDLYDDVFNSMGSNVTVTREMDLLETSFVDSITKNILQSMGEPETFLGLLVRSCEMLVSYTHPDSQNLHYQQIRGYERFAGTMYRELFKSVRNFRNRNLTGRGKVEMSPFAVHQALMEDRSVKTCEDINPVQNLKMHESVTFAGEGGRDKDAFMDEARAMTEEDVGVVAEASVDSGDVGYNIFMAANPNIATIRGQRDKNITKNEAGHYYSSSLMLAVGAAHDD